MGKQVLAVDIGAGSGRVIAGFFDGKQIHMEEVHRFTHELVEARGILYWDVLYIWNEVRRGIGMASGRFGKPDAVSIDAFAPDFCFIDRQGGLIGPSRSYRNYTDGVMRREAIAHLDADTFQRVTGNARIDIALLPQLLALKQSGLAQKDTDILLLPIPNLLNYFLGGSPCTDFTQASISMLYDWKKREWSEEILDAFGIDGRILPKVELSPKVIGRCSLPGLEETWIINIGSHDTAVANYLLSELQEDAIYLNTGTWTSVGVRQDVPLENNIAEETGLSSFGLPDGTFLQCKNVIGMWFLQELKRCFKMRGKDYSYQDMAGMARLSEPLPQQLNLLSPRYLDAFGTLLEDLEKDLAPGAHARIQEGQVVRYVYDFISDAYFGTIQKIEAYTEKTYPTIVLGGGAVRDGFLRECIENKCGKAILRAPAESAALGNVLLQLEALGEITSKDQRQEIIRLFVSQGETG